MLFVIFKSWASKSIANMTFILTLKDSAHWKWDDPHSSNLNGRLPKETSVTLALSSILIQLLCSCHCGSSSVTRSPDAVCHTVTPSFCVLTTSQPYLTKFPSQIFKNTSFTRQLIWGCVAGQWACLPMHGCWMFPAVHQMSLQHFFPSYDLKATLSW